ncbi:DUF2341 domain-containing protein [Candidatus Beckwithbacteria bacterium]|nr:DUF2341 domain-containing protein [Candidatus Beckwithbacteria bacterium]
MTSFDDNSSNNSFKIVEDRPANLHSKQKFKIKLNFPLSLLIFMLFFVGGWILSGSLSPVIREGEVFLNEVGTADDLPEKVLLNRYKCLGYPYETPIWTNILAGDYTEALGYSTYKNTCIADKPLGYAYDDSGMVDGKTLKSLYAINCVYNASKQIETTFYTTDETAFNRAKAGQISGCTIKKAETLAYVFPDEGNDSEYLSLKMQSNYETSIKKDFYNVCLKNENCGGEPNVSFSLTAYLEPFESNPADGSTIKDRRTDDTTTANIDEKLKYYKEIILAKNPSNKEILLTINTKELKDANKIQADCDDIQFFTSSGKRLNHWIESGCNTTTTQVWVELDSPIVQTIRMYYGNTSLSEKLALDDSAWADQSPITILPFRSSCPSDEKADWKALNLSGAYVRGSLVYGNYNNNGSHKHIWTGSLGAIDKEYQSESDSGNKSYTPVSHGHNFTGLSNEVTNKYKYVETPFCYISGIPSIIPDSAFIFFETKPRSWAIIDSIIGKFPVDAKNYNLEPDLTSVNNSHKHNYSNFSSSTYSPNNTQGRDTGSSILAHYHTISGTTSQDEILPKYKDMIMAYNNTDPDQSLPKGGVIASNFEILPPLGWQYYSALVNNIVRANSDSSGTGGSEIHKHTVIGTVSKAVGNSVTVDGSKSGKFQTAHKDHKHALAANLPTGYASSLPSYFDVVFVQKKDDGLTSDDITIGSEQNNGTTPINTTCINDAKRCNDGVPQKCVSNAWVNQTACVSGKTCSEGNCVDADYSFDIKVNLEKKSNDSSSSVKVFLYDGTTKKKEAKISVNNSGEGTWGIDDEDLTEGSTYKLYIKPEGYLSRGKDITLTKGSAINGTISEEFLAGDLKNESNGYGNDLINSADYSIFKNYMTDDNNIADFNGDGVVNSIDYSGTFKVNYDKKGSMFDIIN